MIEILLVVYMSRLALCGDPCSTYEIINVAGDWPGQRDVEKGHGGDILDDRQIPHEWARFMNNGKDLVLSHRSAGVGENCGCCRRGWLFGSYPAQPNVETPVTYCFRYYSDCKFSKTAKVIKCVGYEIDPYYVFTMKGSIPSNEKMCLCTTYTCNGIPWFDGDACNAHGKCNSNGCSCSGGYSGEYCCPEGRIGESCSNWLCDSVVNTNTEKVCSGHGTCSSQDVCVCDTSDYFGSYCKEWMCYGVGKSHEFVCSSHGECVESDSCTCDPKWRGSKCDNWTCSTIHRLSSDVCNSHGECFDVDQCQCELPYSGTNCEFGEEHLPTYISNAIVVGAVIVMVLSEETGEKEANLLFNDPSTRFYETHWTIPTGGNTNPSWTQYITNPLLKTGVDSGLLEFSLNFVELSDDEKEDVKVWILENTTINERRFEDDEKSWQILTSYQSDRKHELLYYDSKYFHKLRITQKCSDIEELCRVPFMLSNLIHTSHIQKAPLSKWIVYAPLLVIFGITILCCLSVCALCVIINVKYRRKIQETFTRVKCIHAEFVRKKRKKTNFNRIKKKKKKLRKKKVIEWDNNDVIGWVETVGFEHVSSKFDIYTGANLLDKEIFDDTPVSLSTLNEIFSCHEGSIDSFSSSLRVIRFYDVLPPIFINTRSELKKFFHKKCKYGIDRIEEMLEIVTRKNLNFAFLLERTPNELSSLFNTDNLHFGIIMKKNLCEFTANILCSNHKMFIKMISDDPQANRTFKKVEEVLNQKLDPIYHSRVKGTFEQASAPTLSHSLAINPMPFASAPTLPRSFDLQSSLMTFSKQLNTNFNEITEIDSNLVTHVLDEDKEPVSLGRGSFGKIYLCNLKYFGYVAVKELDCTTAKAKRDVEKEIIASKSLVHPNVLCTLGYYHPNKHSFRIVMEYLNGGNLFELWSKYSLSYVEKWVIIKKMVKSVEYLHKMGIIHRDIKGTNFLFSKDLSRVVICDFGLARLKGEHQTMLSTKGLAGTVRYMPKECFDNPPLYTKGSDIWSLGMTILEIVTESIPYQGIHDNCVMLEIHKGNLPPVVVLKGLKKKNVPQKIVEIINMCLVIDRKQRMSAKKILEYMETSEEKFMKKNGEMENRV